MTVEKVLLTKEQAVLIEKLKEREVELDELLDLRLRYGFIKDENKCLNDLSATEIATAFLVGYEVEVTPYDKIKALYEKYDDDIDMHSLGFIDGLHQTLECLGIKIEGVNK